MGPRAAAHYTALSVFGWDVVAAVSLMLTSDAIAQRVEIYLSEQRAEERHLHGMGEGRRSRGGAASASPRSAGQQPACTADAAGDGDGGGGAAAPPAEEASPQGLSPGDLTPRGLAVAEVQVYDCARSQRMVPLGVWSAAVLFGWYHLLMYWVPGKTVGDLVTKVCLDQTFSAVFYCPVFLILNTLLADGSGRNVCNVLSKDWLASTVFTWAFWIPEDAIMMSLLPSKYWILCDKIVDLVYLPVISYLAHRNIAKPTQGVWEPDGAGDGEGDEEEAGPEGGEGKAARRASGSDCAVM